MDPLNSTYNYRARLDRISIDKSSEPIKNEATLLLKKQKVLPANASAGPPSTAQHWMEVHVDGRLMVRHLSCIGLYMVGFGLIKHQRHTGISTSSFVSLLSRLQACSLAASIASGWRRSSRLCCHCRCR